VINFISNSVDIHFTEGVPRATTGSKSVNIAAPGKDAVRVNESLKRVVVPALVLGLLLCAPVVEAAVTIGATPYATIQDAIDASVAGDTIEVGAGTYAENLVINGGGAKEITINGVGSGSDDASNTIIDGITGQTINIRAGGTAAGQRVILSNLRVTGGVGAGNVGMGIQIGGGADISHITFDNVSSVGNGGHGIGLNHTFAMDDLVISQSLVADNDGAGIRFPTSLSSLGTVDVSNTTIQDNLGIGFISYSPGTISITDSTFSGNATNLHTGGDLVLTSFDSGSVTLDNVSITSDNADCAIRISPNHDGGTPRYGIGGATISMTDVTISGTQFKNGTYASAAIYLSRMKDLAPADITFSNVVINSTADHGLWLGTITDSTLDLDGEVDFSGGTFAQYSIAQGRHGDTGSTSYGLSNADVLADGLGLTEADVYDNEDDPSLGSITLVQAAVPALSVWGMIMLVLLLVVSVSAKLDTHVPSSSSGASS
jgi:hypothetical protein